MTTIDSIKQELKRRVEEHETFAEQLQRSVMKHHVQLYQSDRALLTAIEGLEEVAQAVCLDPKIVPQALHNISEQWEGNLC